jgi:lipoprotein-anchoring transpeptidase ErfK/SrfK
VIDADVVPDEGEGEEGNEKAQLVEPAKKSDVTDLGKPTDFEAGVRLQIFLDQKMWGPGFIDGKPGNFTARSVYAYNRSKGRSPGDWGAVMVDVEAELGETYATAIVPDVAKEWVDSKLPRKRSLQAKKKRMSYRSYLEFMAERYHTSETFLEELNGKKVAWGLEPRKALKVPNIDPFRIELLKEGKVNHESEEFLNRTVIIDTKGKQIFIYAPGEVAVASGGAVIIVEEEDGEALTSQKLIAAFPITPGKTQFIHRGVWKIANSIELPSWRYDKQLLKTGKRGKTALQIPPGPNNPVGIIWNGLTKSGIGIHGTSSPRTIGRSRSAGCIRMSNWDAARFPTLVRPGVKVVVR